MTALGQKRLPITRSWDLARQKIEDEGNRCRVCRSSDRVEAAHVVGREHDVTPPLGWPINGWGVGRRYVVAPDRVLPLCNRCHQGPNGQHAKRLDLLPHLSLSEQLQAVADAGSLSRAYDLLMPSESPKRVAA